MGAPLIQLVNVEKCFRAGTNGPDLPVLKGISLQLNAGESIAIIGPSGSGKSTLLNILGTLDRPDSGAVSFEGKDLTALSEKELALFRNKTIGFVFQAHHLLPQCTVLENVLVPTLASAPQAGSEERARSLLQRVGLAERLHHRPSQLSGGERQRVAVVRALINQPKLLLADEPTGALDRASADQLALLLSELNAEQKVSLVTVTHSVELARRMGRILELRDGQLAAAKL